MKYKKIKSNESDNGMVLNIINQIIEMFPEFETKKKTIISKLINTKNTEDNVYSNLIFDRIILNNNVYYKDKINYLWDMNASIIGIYIDDTTYYLFDEINELRNEVIETFKNINGMTYDLFN